MKLMKTEDAVGQILCHDITQIIKGVTKDAVFRKGHVIREEDIPILLSVGKDHIYIWENNENMLHENEAAQILYDICKNDHMRPTEVKEGKIELTAAIDGLFLVDRRRLNAVNALENVMIATRHGGTAVRRGDALCGTRVIPLVIGEEKLARAEAIGGGRPLLELLPWKIRTAGIVTTGSEVARGLIQDAFTPVVEAKLAEFGIAVTARRVVEDGEERVARAIAEVREAGAELVLCTGGMSVDPDDNTPGAVKRSGARIVAYGAPVLPGAMFLLGYFQDGTPVAGLPGCVMYAKRTIFDLVLPKLAAGVPITREDITVLGEGGLCLSCEVCTYPNCGFGK